MPFTSVVGETQVAIIESLVRAFDSRRRISSLGIATVRAELHGRSYSPATPHRNDPPSRFPWWARASRLFFGRQLDADAGRLSRCRQSLRLCRSGRVHFVWGAWLSHDRPMTSLEQSYRTARRVTLAGIAVSAVLAVANIAVGLLEQSTSVSAAGFEFAGDVLASVIVLIGMTVAARPADENHPYGHGRIETLSAFIVGGILTLAGVSICVHALRAVTAVHAPPGRIAAVPLLCAIGMRSGMSMLKFRVGRRLRSAALIADAWNDAVDILSAAAALTAGAGVNGSRPSARAHWHGPQL